MIYHGRTGFMVRADMLGAVNTFVKPANDRVCRLDIRATPQNFSIISAYAPTNDGDEEEKDAFYADLDALIDSIPEGSFPILMGDFNAKVGKADEPLTDNGRRLLDLAVSKDLVIRSTMDKRSRGKKITWLSNDGKTRNQIDHVLVPGRLKSAFRSVVSVPEAKVGSDHLMVRAVCSLNPNKRWAPRAPPAKTDRPFAVGRLVEADKAKEFADRVAELLKTNPPEEDATLDQLWEHLRSAILTAAEEKLGRQKSLRYFKETTIVADNISTSP
ncbi:craniofacial development protein 2-like [Frankliniella occidentalis]|uniref:Craniofacial development protein 2-like n=1 Tax=Frankliniella occidentalis TaxID=133901 RepID=A0A9C6XU71_FRAOC|nr:craniofacial development protein 2-like [Frankliniella occidentalis]